MEKVLTIVIPTYNMEKYLRRCLDSLIIEDKELFNQLEVLVVNDGSRDSSSSIAHEYQDRCPEVFRVIDKENGNYGSCVNRGLAEAKGKYIKVLDADDTFDTKNFYEFLLFLQKTDVDGVLSDMIQVNEYGQELDKTKFNLPAESNFTLNNFLEVGVINLWMHNVCYRTDNLREVEYKQTEGISYTDQEWICVPMSTCKTVVYFPCVVYKYLVGREGQTIDTTIWEKNFWMEIKGLHSMIDQKKRASQYNVNTNYINERIRIRIMTIYSAYFGKFKSFKNNNLVRDFDLFLSEYDRNLYISMEKKIRILKYWRIDYNPNKISVRILRRTMRFYNRLYTTVRKLMPTQIMRLLIIIKSKIM